MRQLALIRWVFSLIDWISEIPIIFIFFSEINVISKVYHSWCALVKPDRWKSSPYDVRQVLATFPTKNRGLPAYKESSRPPALIETNGRCAGERKRDLPSRVESMRGMRFDSFSISRRSYGYIWFLVTASLNTSKEYYTKQLCRQFWRELPNIESVKSNQKNGIILQNFISHPHMSRCMHTNISQKFHLCCVFHYCSTTN